MVRGEGARHSCQAGPPQRNDERTKKGTTLLCCAPRRPVGAVHARHLAARGAAAARRAVQPRARRRAGTFANHGKRRTACAGAVRGRVRRGGQRKNVRTPGCCSTRVPHWLDVAPRRSVGRRLALRLGAPFLDADDYHAAEAKGRTIPWPYADGSRPLRRRAPRTAKMRSGVPLTDADRAPWLARVAAAAAAALERCGKRVALYAAALAAKAALRWLLHLAHTVAADSLLTHAAHGILLLRKVMPVHHRRSSWRAPHSERATATSFVAAFLLACSSCCSMSTLLCCRVRALRCSRRGALACVALRLLEPT